MKNINNNNNTDNTNNNNHFMDGIQNTPKLKRRKLLLFEKMVSESNIYCHIDDLNKDKSDTGNKFEQQDTQVIVIDDDNDNSYTTPTKKKKKSNVVIDLDSYTPIIVVDSDDDIDKNINIEEKKPIKKNLFQDFFIKEKSENSTCSPSKTRTESKKSTPKKKISNIGIKKDINNEKNKPIKKNLIDYYFKKNTENVNDNSNKTKMQIKDNDSITNIKNKVDDIEVNKNMDLEKKKPIKKNLIDNYLIKGKENSNKNSFTPNKSVIDLEINDTLVNSYSNFYNDSVDKFEKLEKTLEKYGILIDDSDKELDNNDKTSSYSNVCDDNVNKFEKLEKTLEKYGILIDDSDKESNNNDNSDKETLNINDDDDMSDDLDLLTMDKDIENLFGIKNSKEDKEDEKDEDKIVLINTDESNKSNKRNIPKNNKKNNEKIEKRKADLSIFNDNSSNKKIKPLFNLKEEIKHKDDVDRFINFDFEKFEKDYEENIENPQNKNKVKDDEQSSTTMFSNIFDEDDKAPLTEKETRELKEFMNVDQKKFSTIIINIFPDFNNNLNEWHHELSNKNSDTNTKYMRNNSDKNNKSLYEMCLTDYSLCKSVISQKLFYLYYKTKMNEFQDRYLDLLLKVLCFERNIINSRNSMICIKDLFLNKETYDIIQNPKNLHNAESNVQKQESTSKRKNSINNIKNGNNGETELQKLMYSPVKLFEKILSFYGFRITDYYNQINQIKELINDTNDNNINEESLNKYRDSIQLFASCTTIQYNILDNEEFNSQVKKNIDNNSLSLPIYNFIVVIELIEAVSLFCIKNNIEFCVSEVLFLITVLFMDYNIKNIKINLQTSIKHIIQNLDKETWEKESSDLIKLILFFYNNSAIYQHHILTLFTFSGCHPRSTILKSTLAKLFIKPDLFNEVMNNKLYPITKFIEDTLYIDEKIYNLNDNTNFQEIYYRISIYYHCFGYIDEVSKSENKELIDKTTKKLWILHNRIPDMLASHIDRTYSKNFILQLIQYLNSLFIKTKITI